MSLTPFHYADQEVRVVTVDGEPWFVLADLCTVLDLSNVADVRRRLPHGVDQTYPISIGWIYRTQRGDWAPYQAQIETGRLVVKLSRAENSRTGEEFATTTVRITPKGVAKLATLLEVAPATVADALASEGVAA